MEPFDLEERLLHVREAKRRLDTSIPWLCDSLSNDLKHAFGDRNNSEFVIGADGSFKAVRNWSDPAAVRKDLEEMIGPVDKLTSVADLGRDPQPAPRLAPRGVVPRIERPANLVAIKSSPKLGTGKGMPYYVKLRAEAQGAVLGGAEGAVLLGFHLDPLYGIHWNNLAAPLKFSISAPDGVKVTPESGTAPNVEEESDSDPREFLLSVSGATPDKPILLRVDYFACHDQEGWCKAVSQEYEIFVARDRDAGRVMSGGRRGGGPGRGGGGAPRGGAASIIARIFESDTDGDGKISRDEAPERMAPRFDQMDSNGDGFVDRSEIEARFRQRFRR